MDGYAVEEIHPDNPSPVEPGSVLVVFGDQDLDVYVRAYFGLGSGFSRLALLKFLKKWAPKHKDVVGWASKMAAAYVVEARPESLVHSDHSSALMMNPERCYFVRLNTTSGLVEFREYPAPYSPITAVVEDNGDEVEVQVGHAV